MKQSNIHVVLSIFIFSVALLASVGAVAQTSQEISEEVVVVGTRGEARSPLDSAVPIDVISADDIAAAHSFGGELGELLQALSPSFNFPRQSNSGAGDHVRAAQLRGMSPDHTLVLVNGKRQHTASIVALESAIGLGTNPFDFNTIPLIAIKRIEILRDGAGAQDGSDAIAGVINIVLKDAAEGGTVTASYGAHRTDFEPISADLDDGETFSVAADYGFTVGDGGSLRIGAEYRSRDATNRAGIGVLPFVNGGSFGQDAEDFEALTVGMQQLVMTELAINTNLRIVTRSQLDQLMAEQDLGASGRVDAETAARLGRLVGAKYMVMGGFIDLYGEMTMTTQIVDSETSEIVKAEKVTDKRENIYAMVVQLADQVTRGVDLAPLSRQAMQQRKDREIPQEAVRLYTRAMLYEQRGNTDRAIELYTQVATQFPQYTEAQQQLEQLRGD